MKFRKITIIALIAVMAFALAACGAKTKTLESYISKDKTAADEINKAADEAGMTVDIKDNTVTYIYDISNMGDTITEELAKSAEIKSSLDQALDSAGDTFVSLCKSLEDEAKVEGVQIVVRYTFKDYVITERTFTSAG